MYSSNIFVPVATAGPLPTGVERRTDHPVPRKGITGQSGPIATNKFYANFFLGTQGQATWTHPYSVSWSKGSGNARSWGLSISHVDANQRAYGPGDPVQYFINPIEIQSIILSAAELSSATVLTTDSLQAFSANVNFHQGNDADAGITFPLVQGMGFVTAIYRGLKPAVQSSVFFRSLTRVPLPSRPEIIKYKIVLEDGNFWLLYAHSSSGGDLNLQVVSNSLIQATSFFFGTIQVAKNPDGTAEGEAMYDASAGVYPTQAEVSGQVEGPVGNYTLRWTKGGTTANASPLLMFALPHHVKSFDSTTANAVRAVRLQTTTKGRATAVVSDSWSLVEGHLPIDIGFAPWSSTYGTRSSLSPAAMQVINSVASGEISQDMNAQTNLDSMYFSGKALSKFATIVYTVHDMARNPSLATTGLEKLKAAFAVFVRNKQTYPLVYESAWKGVVSTGSYATGDPGQDFGNSYYNDHHFHYGYFVHAAAVIGYLDPSWLSGNREWVNMLVRDAANPSTQDSLFPFSRSFDWYHGHSWAKGLFESADGKDEESSSEDAFFAYALKMWGKTIGDASMEARGNLMLAILTRTLQDYFLMEDNNANQPPNFIADKVTGILFENKADHTTYFGANIEYIQGIHMVPLNPSSALTRTRDFVAQEWARFFDNGRADTVVGGWRGILYANLAIINAAASWEFFAQQNFDPGWIDGGASRTWYLAYAAGETIRSLVAPSAVGMSSG
ncbi:MAG: hypothetical protein M1833_004438 [Piccolia ochrophora]|nr:MAG: hypothetical protein M1833_004438 [Piccolia ochrophora]